jgi:hypothetical protein
MSIKKYKSFKGIKEVRRPKKCPVLDFTPLIESDTYKDMIEMGFLEVVKGKYNEIETLRSDAQRSFKDSLGNIAFFHPDLSGGRGSGPNYPYINIKHDGGVRSVQGPSRSTEFVPGRSDAFRSFAPEFKRTCMTIDDYLFKMSFLIKYLIHKQGFPIPEADLYGEKSYRDVIKEVLRSDPSLASKITIPSSIKREDTVAKGASLLKRFGAFDD